MLLILFISNEMLVSDGLRVVCLDSRGCALPLWCETNQCGRFAIPSFSTSTKGGSFVFWQAGTLTPWDHEGLPAHCLRADTLRSQLSHAHSLEVSVQFGFSGLGVFVY